MLKLPPLPKFKLPTLPKLPDVRAYLPTLPENFRGYIIAIVSCAATWFGINTASDLITSPSPLPQQFQQSTCESITWTVPDGVKSVKVRIKNPNGSVKNQYTITDYISMEPKQKVELVPNC